jgi:5'-methylthioadenosine phosphorylase
MTKTVLGIIGGSGVYDIAGLENPRWERVKSPWGEPSDALLFGTYAGVDMVFLPRHGRGHVQTPSTINYRANIDALKRAGVTDAISVSACGSLKEELPPGTFVIVDQFIDRTFAREKSFFGPGFVAHVPMAHPVCPRLTEALVAAAREEGIRHAEGGTYICMEGPQFSTLAESNLYRSWGCSVVGMTAMPEAKLAREAELPYALVAMVTDYDCWHPDHDHVTVDAVINVLVNNAGHARKLVCRAATKLGPARTPSPLGIEHVLDTALITAPDRRDPRLTAKLDAVAGRVLSMAGLDPANQ